MTLPHSPCAALIGICECDNCKRYRNNVNSEILDEYQSKSYDNVINKIDDWHMWTIRSWNLRELRLHRIEMESMGFRVGPITKSDGCGVPENWYIFGVRIMKSSLSKECFESLCSWDEKFGDLNDK